MTPRKLSMVSKAVLVVLRNGKPRHTGEISERLRDDHRVDIGPKELGQLLHRLGGVVKDGNVQVSGGTSGVWRLEEPK